MDNVATPSQPPTAVPTNPNLRAVNFEHTGNWPHLLEQLGVSLLISTYQAGKVVVVGCHEGKLAFSFHNFEQAMGIAVQPGQIAVGSRRQIWFLRAAHDLAPRLQPAGKYDGCYLTRKAHFTGSIHGHELVWAGSELWVVNTLFSCLCTLDEQCSFVPRWRPPFISALAGEDRCHLNGLALEGDRPRFVTTLAATDTPAGWRPTKATSGCLIDVPSGAIVVQGLSMPHSPRLHQGKLWVLDSGRGRLSQVDPPRGTTEAVAEVLGFTRGVDFRGSFAFVGMSKIRESNVFGGLPIGEKREQLKCGVSVIDLRTGHVVACLEFHSGVEEIFDVKVLPGIRCPAVSGPFPDHDGNETIWLVPPERPGGASARAVRS